MGLDMAKYRRIFLEESNDHLAEISRALIDLEKEMSSGDAIEPIFWRYGGRPHWGKWHSLDAARLKDRYAHWDDFAKVRDRLDPKGKMLNAHLSTVLGAEKRG